MSPTCRFCDLRLNEIFVDLGKSPLSNSFLKLSELKLKENQYPLRAFVCKNCFLVQLEEFQSPENIFSDYAYFSSYSESWLEHSKKFTTMMKDRFNLNEDNLVIEIGSNDGYLLQFFKEEKIPILGIEPAKNVAKVAEEKGIPTIKKFFGKQIANELKEQNSNADLIIGNNVLAHVPKINDFVEGLKILLKPKGVISIEFPHILKLIEFNQFDTIYHEHFSYFSLYTAKKIFEKHELTIFDVEEIPTHGGSLRIFAKHSDNNAQKITEKVIALLEKEHNAGLLNIETYRKFSKNVEIVKEKLYDFCINAKKENKKIIGYGAPAKGNTLLNFCKINSDLIEFTVDLNPHKQGKVLPGSHIPIKHPDIIKEIKPDYILILPWNLQDEIILQMNHIRKWGGKFVIPIPEVKIL